MSAASPDSNPPDVDPAASTGGLVSASAQETSAAPAVTGDATASGSTGAADADGDADGDLVDLVLPVFVPPTDAPPLPDELRPLADALVAETERLIDLARDIAARLPAPSMVQRRFTSGAEGGAFDRAL
jgi:hypothetical protein